MSFTALNDRIFIKPDPAQDKVGSLYLPPAAAERRRREQGCTGIVRHMGPGLLQKDGTRAEMPDVKVGDRVIYLDQPWTETEIAGEKLLSIRTGGIIAVVENDR